MKASILAVIVMWTALSAMAQGTTNLAHNWSTVDGGGGVSSNSFGRLTGTIGQPDAGKMTAGNFTLAGGFWAAGAAIQTPGAPLLMVFRTSTNTVCICWPLPDTGWRLQAAADLSAKPVVWTEVPSPYHATATDLYHVEPVPAGPRYYRLQKP